MTADTSRPLAITAVGWLFIVVGVASIGSGIWKFLTSPTTPDQLIHSGHEGLDLLLVILIACLAIAGGRLVLRGRTMGRHLLLAWMAIHVVVSMMHSVSQLMMHVAIFAVLTALLFVAPSRSFLAGG